MHTRRTESLTPKFAWLAAAALLHCSCGARTRAAESNTVADSGVEVAEPVALESKPTPQPTKAREVVAHVVGTISVQEALRQPGVTAVALIPGSPSPRAVLACDHSDRTWLGVFNFDTRELEHRRTVGDPQLDCFLPPQPDVQASFVAVQDLDGDGLDDIVGHWDLSDGSDFDWPRARIAAWSSRTLEELRSEDLLDGVPGAHSRPIHGARGSPTSWLLLLAAQHVRPTQADNWRRASTIYSYSFATGQRSTVASVLDQLDVWSDRTAPLESSADGSLFGLATITASNAERDLVAIRFGSDGHVWRRPASELSPRRILHVEPAPDLDARGVTDLLVNFADEPANSRLLCIAGEDGAVLWSAAAPTSRPIAHHIGDVDRDGVLDVLVGQSVGDGYMTHSPVVIRSGRTGEVLWDVRDTALVKSFFSHHVATRVDSDGAWCLVGDESWRVSLLRITARDI